MVAREPRPLSSDGTESGDHGVAVSPETIVRPGARVFLTRCNPKTGVREVLLAQLSAQREQRHAKKGVEWHLPGGATAEASKAGTVRPETLAETAVRELNEELPTRPKLNDLAIYATTLPLRFTATHERKDGNGHDNIDGRYQVLIAEFVGEDSDWFVTDSNRKLEESRAKGEDVEHEGFAWHSFDSLPEGTTDEVRRLIDDPDDGEDVQTIIARGLFEGQDVADDPFSLAAKLARTVVATQYEETFYRPYAPHINDHGQQTGPS